MKLCDGTCLLRRLAHALARVARLDQRPCRLWRRARAYDLHGRQRTHAVRFDRRASKTSRQPAHSAVRL